MNTSVRGGKAVPLYVVVKCVFRKQFALYVNLGITIYLNEQPGLLISV